MLSAGPNDWGSATQPSTTALCELDAQLHISAQLGWVLHGWGKPSLWQIANRGSKTFTDTPRAGISQRPRLDPGRPAAWEPTASGVPAIRTCSTHSTAPFQP